ncbi:hypothetical protein MKEN_00017200 [Mycena kentingensis (nom. inval.)]|nr:hypothetical protein MKEN_00017200 [Mycena kentingensis (nom. inval.)]
MASPRRIHALPDVGDDARPRKRMRLTPPTDAAASDGPQPRGAQLLLALPALIAHPPTHPQHKHALWLSLVALRKCLALPNPGQPIGQARKAPWDISSTPLDECRAWTALAEVGITVLEGGFGDEDWTEGIEAEVHRALGKALVIAQKHPTLELYTPYLTRLSARATPQRARLLLKPTPTTGPPPGSPAFYYAHLAWTDHLLNALLYPAVPTKPAPRINASPVKMSLSASQEKTLARDLVAFRAAMAPLFDAPHATVALLARVIELRAFVALGRWPEVPAALERTEAALGMSFPMPEGAPTAVYMSSPFYAVVAVHVLILGIVWYSYSAAAGAGAPEGSPGSSPTPVSARLTLLYTLLDVLESEGVVEIPLDETQPPLYIRSTHPRVLYVLGYLISAIARRDLIGRKPKRKTFVLEGLGIVEREATRELKVPRWASAGDVQAIELQTAKIRADLLCELVGVCIMRSEFAEAEKTLNEAIAHTRTFGLFEGTMAPRITLLHAQLAHARGQAGRARTCYRIASKLALAAGDTAGSVSARVGEVILLLGLHARGRLTEDVRMPMADGDPGLVDVEEKVLEQMGHDVAAACRGLGGAMRAVGEVIEGVLTTEILTAKQHLKHALSYATEHQDNHLRALILGLISAHYLHTAGDQAGKMLATCEQLALGLGAPSKKDKGKLDTAGNAPLRLWVGERFLELHQRAGQTNLVGPRAESNAMLRQVAEGFLLQSLSSRSLVLVPPTIPNPLFAMQHVWSVYLDKRRTRGGTSLRDSRQSDTQSTYSAPTSTAHMLPVYIQAPREEAHPLEPPRRPFLSTGGGSASSRSSTSSARPTFDAGGSTVSLQINYVPSKFAGPGSGVRRRGGGLAGEARMPGPHDGVDVGGKHAGGSGSGRKKPKWNRFKWVLVVMNTVYTGLALAGLVFVVTVWFDVWRNADVVRVGNRMELVMSTTAAGMALLTAIVGWAGIVLNNRGFLAVYTFFLWISFALLVLPGYVTFKKHTFNLEGKINRQWSRDLGASGRLRVQNQLGCCGYYSPFVEATVSPTCYSRSILPGCKKDYTQFERRLLRRWYTALFAGVPVTIGAILAGLLCSNHITYRFGKGMMPKAYRLSEKSMAVIAGAYAQQLAEEYGTDMAEEIMARSYTNLNASPSASEENTSKTFSMYPLEATYGAWLVALVLESVLYGIGVVQTYLYFHWWDAETDGWSVRGPVLIVLLFETVQIVFFTASTYKRFVAHFGEVDTELIWVDSVQLLANYLTAFAVQLYFASRIWRLARKASSLFSVSRWGIYVVVFLAFTQMAAGAVQTGWTSVLGSFLELERTKACHLFVTYGQPTDGRAGNDDAPNGRLPRNGMPRTQKLLRAVMLNAINRGMLTSLTSFGTMVLFVAYPRTFWFFLTLAPNSKLYMNSMLATLNMRAYHGRKLDGSEPGTVALHTHAHGPVSDVEFVHPPPPPGLEAAPPGPHSMTDISTIASSKSMCYVLGPGPGSEEAMGLAV